jgi:nucleoside phosphorylase
MDSKDWKLDFGMRILLAHALKSESGSIRQHYPLAKTIIREHGQVLTQLDSNLHLLRTGIGLEASRTAMRDHVNPEKLDLIIHFGVSGSLTNHLPVMHIVQGIRFSCPGELDLSIKPPELLADISIPAVSFYSSPEAILDESGRDSASATGAKAVDMESYSVAQFCQAWHIPLLAIRCISDRAGASTPDDFRKNYSRASEVLQKFLLKNILNPLR